VLRKSGKIFWPHFENNLPPFLPSLFLKNTTKLSLLLQSHRHKLSPSLSLHGIIVIVGDSSGDYISTSGKRKRKYFELRDAGIFNQWIH
jgi:hypothetical protein